MERQICSLDQSLVRTLRSSCDWIQGRSCGGNTRAPSSTMSNTFTMTLQRLSQLSLSSTLKASVICRTQLSIYFNLQQRVRNRMINIGTPAKNNSISMRFTSQQGTICQHPCRMNLIKNIIFFAPLLMNNDVTLCPPICGSNKNVFGVYGRDSKFCQ